MLLSDAAIRGILDGIDFRTDDRQRPFKPDEQVQPASVDLRLDRCVWFPRKSYRKKISLLAASLSEIGVQRLYERRWLGLGDSFVIRPGEMVMGRTFEMFTIPNGHAGKLEGRSTFARLGLSIHCTGDFINPGWRGRMPLQLVNHGKVPIVLTPYVDICQLLIFQTTGPSLRAYGSDDLTSKYMNEEGEPSRVWLDVRLKNLREACGRVNLADRVYKEFFAKLGDRDVRILDRFVEFLDSRHLSGLTNSHEIMSGFAGREERRKKVADFSYRFFKWFPFLMIAPSVALASVPTYSWTTYAVWAATLLLLVPGIYHQVLAEPPGEYFLQKDLEP